MEQGHNSCTRPDWESWTPLPRHASPPSLPPTAGQCNTHGNQPPQKSFNAFHSALSLGTFSRWHQILNLKATPFDDGFFLHVTSPSNPVFARQELGKSWREKCDVDQTQGGARKWQLLLEGTLKAAFVRDSRCRWRDERPRFLLLFPADGNFHAFSSQFM